MRIACLNCGAHKVLPRPMRVKHAYRWCHTCGEFRLFKKVNSFLGQKYQELSIKSLDDFAKRYGMPVRPTPTRSRICSPGALCPLCA